MHLTLKKEATKPAAFNFLQQQERFDDFIEVYNHERPHQALMGAYPADLYTPSARAYQPPPEPEYPYHDRIRPGHALRPHLLRQTQNQPQQGLRRPDRWHPRGRGPDLAGQLPRL
jgi:hypothetical protein